MIDEHRHREHVLAAATAERASRHPVDVARLAIIVTGEVFTHTLQVTATFDRGGPPTQPYDPRSAEHTEVPTSLLMLTQRQREVLEATASPYLQQRAGTRQPLTCKETGRLIGMGPDRVEKHIAEIRRKMVLIGLPNLVDSPDTRATICAHAFDHHLIYTDCAADVTALGRDGGNIRDHSGATSESADGS